VEDEIIEMTRMGRSGWHHMVQSVQTSALRVLLEAGVANGIGEKGEDDFYKEGENLTALHQSSLEAVYRIA
jgi:hypothetical protein